MYDLTDNELTSCLKYGGSLKTIPMEPTIEDVTSSDKCSTCKSWLGNNRCKINGKILYPDSYHCGFYRNSNFISKNVRKYRRI
jgi:hypothetical protein